MAPVVEVIEIDGDMIPSRLSTRTTTKKRSDFDGTRTHAPKDQRLKLAD